VAVEAMRMQILRRLKFWAFTILILGSISMGAWFASRAPHHTPGSHQVFRMDSTPGAMFEFVVILSLIFAGLLAIQLRRDRWIFVAIAGGYLAAIAIVSVLTPQTIVSIGDSYCWDLWCFGIEHVEAAPQGESIAYRAAVSLSVGSDQAQLEIPDQAQQFFYAEDEAGRRFPVRAESSGSKTIKPGEPVKASLTFTAPAGVRHLYLGGDVQAPPWVRLYFGSDLNPLHRRTLLRVL